MQRSDVSLGLCAVQGAGEDARQALVGLTVLCTLEVSTVGGLEQAQSRTVAFHVVYDRDCFKTGRFLLISESFQICVGVRAVSDEASGI